MSKVLFIIPNYDVYKRFLVEYIERYYKFDKIDLIILNHRQESERIFFRLLTDRQIHVLNKFSKSSLFEFAFIIGNLQKYKYVTIFYFLSYRPIPFFMYHGSMKQIAFLMSIPTLCFCNSNTVEIFYSDRRRVYRRHIIGICFFILETTRHIIYILCFYLRRKYFYLLKLIGKAYFSLVAYFRNNKEANKKRRIFISRRGDGLGDFISRTGIDNLIRKINPGAYILSECLSHYKELIQFNHSVDKFILLKNTGIVTLTLTLFRSGILKTFFDQNFQLYLAQDSIGHYLDANVEYSISDIRAAKSLLEDLGRNLSTNGKLDIYPRLIINKKDENTERLLINEGISYADRFVVLGCYSQDTKRIYPEGKFAEVAEKLKDRFHFKVVIVGVKEGLDFAGRISFLMSNKPVVLLGKTSLTELIYIINRSSLVVSIDTSIWHIANALKIPFVIITNRDLSNNYPVDTSIGRLIGHNKQLSCRPPCFMRCLFSEDGYSLCLKMILPDEIINACEDLMKNNDY